MLVRLGAQAACLHAASKARRENVLNSTPRLFHAKFSRSRAQCRQGCLRSQQRALFFNFRFHSFENRYKRIAANMDKAKTPELVY